MNPKSVDRVARRETDPRRRAEFEPLALGRPLHVALLSLIVVVGSPYIAWSLLARFKR